MAFALEILPEYELCVLGCSGRIADFDALWKMFEVTKSYRRDWDSLALLGPDADYSEVASELSEVHALKFVEMNSGIRRLKRSAHICADDVQRAMVKMFAAYVDANGPVPVEFACFSDLEAALAWLASDAPNRFDLLHMSHVLGRMGHRWCCPSAAA